MRSRARQSFWASWAKVFNKSYYTFQPLQLMIDTKFFFFCVLDAKDSGTGTGTGTGTAALWAAGAPRDLTRDP
ncbi:hypothetical protein FANTH_4507 [Fusarium anthophilum]|uniref:Uncharacterized protein n=1 Tax=Fusarium anthophilum TaxID=48485 RepID=A0A8H4ZQ10_9HYPO|nr:hypothetical protein FANTH_4507 [Fusarium anthophilum]